MSSLIPPELKQLLDKAKTEDLEVIKKRFTEYYMDVMDTISAVLRRALFTVERFGQALCVDLNERGLGLDMKTKLEKLEDRMCLTIEYIPKEETILRAMRSPEFKRVIRQMEREIKRIKKARVYERP